MFEERDSETYDVVDSKLYDSQILLESILNPDLIVDGSFQAEANKAVASMKRKSQKP